MQGFFPVGLAKDGALEVGDGLFGLVLAQQDFTEFEVGDKVFGVEAQPFVEMHPGLVEVTRLGQERAQARLRPRARRVQRHGAGGRPVPHGFVHQGLLGK
jgi:acyl-coenzyme A thioesterase PaaI-like protein